MAIFTPPGYTPTRAQEVATKAYVDAKATSGATGVPTFVQQTAPTYGGGPYVWHQTNAAGQVTQTWVEAGSPAPTTNMVERFRAGTITGTSDGATVTSFLSEVGGAALGSGSAAPAVYVASGTAGKAALRFSGSQGYTLSNTAPAVAQPFTIVMVVNMRAVGVGTQELLRMGGAEILVDTGWQSYQGNLVSGGTPTTGMHLVMSSTTNSNATVSVDGTVVATGNGNAGSVSSSNLDLGWHSTAGRYAQMDFYELLVYSVDLADAGNATILNQLKAYVRSTYNMTIS